MLQGSVIEVADWWLCLHHQMQVNGTSSCKRKHQDDIEGSSEDVSCSGCKLKEMKASGRSRTQQGAVFWPAAWRTKLCLCADCKVLLNVHFICTLGTKASHISLFVSGVMVQHVYLFVCLDPLCRRRSVFPHRWGRHGPGIWEQGQVHRAGRTGGSWPLDVSPRQPESCSAAGDHSWLAHLVVLL